jgi:membrane dipeptidase
VAVSSTSWQRAWLTSISRPSSQDLSHVSDETAEQALDLTRSPVIWSHSSARHFNKIQRNVPDHLLERLGTSEGKVDGVVHVNFYPGFLVGKGQKGDVSTVADHVEWVAKKAGHKHVGLGSDYDGIESTPAGLEDVSKYPTLFAELIRRGWTDAQLEDLAGGNTLRILEGVERVKEELMGEPASMGRYTRRKDL